MSSLFYTLLVPVLSYFLWNLIGIIKNIRKARAIGIPVVWSPVSPENPIWIICSKKVAPYIRRLPFGDWTDYSTIDWTWNDRENDFKVLRKYGKVFAHVMPGKLVIRTADPAMVHRVLSDRRAFVKSLGAVYMLDIYGPSVVSRDGNEWQRHRRITTRSFGESVHRIAWPEAVRQTEQMVELWSQDERGFRSTARDFPTLTLNVLMRAAYGVQYDFHDSSEKVPPKGHNRTYRDCLREVMDMRNIVLLNIVPSFIFSFPWAPRRLRSLQTSSRELEKYLIESVVACRETLKSSPDKSMNFMESLVQENQATTSKSGGLSDRELYGNLFVWTLGGHETTANTLLFALFLLAAFPMVQEWLFEELDGIELDYESFPRMKRSLAVMLETLRMFPTISPGSKATGDCPVPMQTMEGDTLIIPPHTSITPNLPALQVLPEVWGPDSLTWRPTRWLDTDDGQLRTPVEGSFEPWGDGSRVCPGKKFAQVEFVAVISCIFSRYKIEAVPEGEESAEDARERVWKAVNKTESGLTLKVENSERVAFKILER
ncbi:cytochrome P450, partial [Phyllosticta citribraziliensis]